MTARREKSYEEVVLDVLAYEFSFTDHGESERKISGRLRRRKLGRYDPERVETLRRMKDALQEEIHRGPRSSYYTGSHGVYADMADFDVSRLASDTAAAHPGVAPELIHGFVPFCVFLYYLR